MTEPSTAPQAQRNDRTAALRAIALSLTVNALCPFLLYRALQPHFPASSVVPLLYATIFPIVGLLLGLIRKRAVDGIAILSMTGLAIHIVVTLLAKNVGIALVIRSLDGLLIGSVLVISALIGRPIILYVARQIAASGSSERVANLGKLVASDGPHTFSTITLVWGFCLMAMSGLHVVLALKLAPANFLLLSPILGVLTVVVLLAWSGRYLASRLRG